MHQIIDIYKEDFNGKCVFNLEMWQLSDYVGFFPQNQGGIVL